MYKTKTLSINKEKDCKKVLVNLLLYIHIFKVKIQNYKIMITRQKKTRQNILKR